MTDWLSPSGLDLRFVRELDGLPWFVFVLVVGLTAAFALVYLLRGVILAWQLTQAGRRLRLMAADERAIDPTRIAPWMQGRALRGPWRDYAASLHPMQLEDAPTEVDGREVGPWRATLPAEAVFTRESLVDARLFDDFARHLPGVLTGLGIIGTFAGLLEGLARFDASSATSAVAGLKPLLDGVAHAFSLSAIAIGCALFVTFAGKLMLAGLYRAVESLTHAIDAIYRGGAGEEYLSRLLRTAEQSERGAAERQDALTQSLGELITRLSRDQIEMQARSTEALGERLDAAVAGPMRELSAAIRRLQDGPDEAATRGRAARDEGLLKGIEKALSGLGERLEAGLTRAAEQQDAQQRESRREQQSGLRTLTGSMEEALRESRAARVEMAEAQARQLDVMIESVESVQAAASRAAEVGTPAPWQQALVDALERSGQAQAAFGEQLSAFVGDSRELINQGRQDSDETAQQTRQAVHDSLRQLAQAVAHIEGLRTRSEGEDAERRARWVDETRSLVGDLASRQERSVQQMQGQLGEARAQIDRIGAGTAESVAALSRSAAGMEAAARRFESAGQTMAAIFDRSSVIVDRLTATAEVLQDASAAAGDGMRQADQARSLLGAQVTALTELVSTTRSEAGVSRGLLQDFERIAEQFRRAQAQSQEYVEGLNHTLVRAFEEFGTAMTNQLRSSLGDTDRHLSSGVHQLNGVVQHLGLALSRMQRS